MNKEKQDIFDLISEIPVAAKSYLALEKIAESKNCTLEQVGRRQIHNVVVMRSSDDINREIWVKPEYRSYKKAWITSFGLVSKIQEKWNSIANEEKVIEYHLDHILPAAVASVIGYDYVRLFPVSDSTNMHFGRSVEKQIKASTTIGNTSGRPSLRDDIEYMDILGLGKVLNFNFHHAYYKRSKNNPPPLGHLAEIQNKDFLKYVRDISYTKKVLHTIGVIW